MSPPIADEFPRAHFGGVIFPIESSKVKGGIRHHVHEYPHQHGGAPEKLGRSLYRFSMVGNFQTRFASYPKLYPEGLRKLVETFELQKTLPLTIPSFGTIDAFCTSWDRDWTARIRSGEKMALEFIEDQAADFVLEAIASETEAPYEPAALLEAAMKEKGLLDQFGAAMSAIQNAVNRVAAARDQADLYGNLVEAELLRIAGLCGTLDRATDLQDPRNHRVVDALHALWASVRAKLDDLDSKRVKLAEFRVPMTMSIQQVSAAIYNGDASRAEDLQGLNAITEAFRVRAGTLIRYYP